MRTLLVLTVLLGGCLSSPPSPSDDGAEPEGETASAAERLTLYVTPNGLSQTPPRDDSIPLGWGYQQWLDGTTPPEFMATTGRLIVHDGILHIHVRAEMPTAGGDLRPELTAWFGTDHQIQHHVFIDGPDALQAGDVVSGPADLRIGYGGLYMRPGDRLFSSFGTYYADGPDLQSMSLLIGAQATRIELNVTRTDWVPFGVTDVVPVQGSLTGNRCLADGNVAGTAQNEHPFQVDENVSAVAVSVEQASGQTPDIDIRIVGPGGEDLGRGQSSLAKEGIFLGPGNLVGAGTYVLRVYACTPQAGTYTGSIELWP